MNCSRQVDKKKIKSSPSGRLILSVFLPSLMTLSEKDEKVYQVGGIITDIEEMFYCAPKPLMVEATLMPFRDVIITDGLILAFE
ncbi:MAG: hypothetical protein RR446_08835 [Lachnospiraceae bacterium]